MLRRLASVLQPPTLLGGLDSRHFITRLPQGYSNLVRAGIIGADLETATEEITIVLVFTHGTPRRQRIIYCGLLYRCPALGTPKSKIAPPTWNFGSPTGNRCRLIFSDIDKVKVNGVPINDAVTNLVATLADQYHQQRLADSSCLPAMMGFMPCINEMSNIQNITGIHYGRTFDLLLDKRSVTTLQPAENKHWCDDIYNYCYQRSVIKANNTILEIETNYVIPINDDVVIVSTCSQYKTDGLFIDCYSITIGGPDHNSIMLYGVGDFP